VAGKTATFPTKPVVWRGSIAAPLAIDLDERWKWRVSVSEIENAEAESHAASHDGEDGGARREITPGTKTRFGGRAVIGGVRLAHLLRAVSGFRGP
jgi:hypothetical protein